MTAAAASMSTARWLYEWAEPGTTWFRIGREGETLVAEWEGLGQLRATAGNDTWRLEVRPRSGLDERLERRWRRGVVQALIRHLRGEITLHASAVLLHGCGLGFIGDSGAGKSTCAADLCLHGGAALVSDDSLELAEAEGRYTVTATDASHWLLPDATACFGFTPPTSGAKAELATREAAPPDQRLGALVLLEYGAELSGPTLRPLRGQAAFTAVSASFFRFILDDRARVAADLDAIARLVQAIPVYVLSRPPTLVRICEARAILDDLARSFSLEPPGQAR